MKLMKLITVIVIIQFCYLLYPIIVNFNKIEFNFNPDSISILASIFGLLFSISVIVYILTNHKKD